jgi:predicted MFS family arabinose efflux permease
MTPAAVSKSPGKGRSGLLGRWHERDTRAALMLAAVLAVVSADTGAIGALAPQLEHSLHMGNTRLGLLVTVVSLVGVVGTLPAGALVDSWDRRRLLLVSLVVWSLAQLLSAFSFNFVVLLAVRVVLGALVAVAGPAVASLTGDLFPARTRSNTYGVILTGEFLGAGAGVLAAGLVGAWFGWRVAFGVLGLPSLAVAAWLRAELVEPERGQQAVAEGAAVEEEPAEVAAQVTPVRVQVEEAGVEADPGIVIDEPDRLSLWGAVRWVLRVRSNDVLIAASSLGYFFFAGLETFAVIYLRGRYGLQQAEATLLLVVIGVGAVAGVLAGGRLTDRWLGKGLLDARLVIPAGGFLAAALLLVPGLLVGAVYVAVPFFVLAAAAAAAPNPGLDAARLDVVPSHLWGRGEGVRTFFRQFLQSFAPLVFGLVSSAFGGGQASIGTGVGQQASVGAAEAHGLQMTFLIMLVPMVLGGLSLLVGRRYYAGDVASAAESERQAEEKFQAALEAAPRGPT